MRSTPREPRNPSARLLPPALALLALALLATPPLAAQPRPAKPAPAQATAPTTAPPAAAALPPGLAEALASIDRGDLAGAIAKLEALQRKDPSPQVTTALGAVYFKANRPADALAILRPLAEGAEANPATLYNAGRAAYAVGRPDLGRRYLERAVAIEPVSPAARELGLIDARQGRSGDAYRLLRPWALTSPDDVEARLAAALLALHFRQTADAAKLLAGLPATSSRAQLLRGELALREGHFKAAVGLLRPLAPSAPPGAVQAGFAADARRLLGEAYLGAGQPAEAVRLLQAQAESDPSAALLVANGQVRQGDLKSGLATLSPWAAKIGGAQNPRDPDLVAEMALAYGRMLAAAGRTQEAATALQTATRLTPASAEAWRDYAATLSALGRKDEAARARARALAATPKAPAAAAPPAAPAPGS
jgi:tetratricopeptide (TPR) repeat protein